MSEVTELSRRLQEVDGHWPTLARQLQVEITLLVEALHMMTYPSGLKIKSWVLHGGVYSNSSNVEYAESILAEHKRLAEAREHKRLAEARVKANG